MRPRGRGAPASAPPFCPPAVLPSLSLSLPRARALSHFLWEPARAHTPYSKKKGSVPAFSAAVGVLESFQTSTARSRPRDITAASRGATPARLKYTIFTSGPFARDSTAASNVAADCMTCRTCCAGVSDLSSSACSRLPRTLPPLSRALSEYVHPPCRTPCISPTYPTNCDPVKMVLPPCNCGRASVRAWMSIFSCSCIFYFCVFVFFPKTRFNIAIVSQQ